jgi:NADPH-dependent curcumin reductase CurA
MDEEAVPEPGPDQALVRVRYLSIDPTIRTWMNDAPGYLPPIAIGEVIRSGGLGEVVATNSSRYQVGDTVFGMTGWQDYTLAGKGAAAVTVIPAGIDPTAVLSVFGTTGMTAYFGMTDVGRVKEGDVVVVSGAAGATGSIAGQVAKLKGAARVVGLAGSAEKCAWLTDEAGFDVAINYKEGHVGRRLHEACPDGIDLYFDNVGGPILDACLANLAMRGRVVVCGAISTYNSDTPVPGPGNYVNLIRVRGRMEGFLVLDYLDRFPEAQAEMATWVAEGRIHHQVHVVNGLEHATDALNLLFDGGNTGKVIVRL